jgi:nuclear pore complex protein Nup133
VRACLKQLLEVLYKTAIEDAETQQDHVEAWRVAAGLCDVLLGGYVDQMNSMEHNPSLSAGLAQVRKQFEAAREKFLSPLLEHGQYDQSVGLAERYRDFQLLVRLCEAAGDRERLKTYISLFSEHGFAEFLFKHLFDRHNIEELLTYSKDFPDQVARFLKPHDHIIWLHHLRTMDYIAAHSTLWRLAQREEKYVGKKKTHLSMSKLALLTSGSENGNEDMRRLDRELSVIEYQLNVPDSVLEELGMDMETMPPLTPADIVQLYVGEVNKTVDETDFLHALELLQIAFEDRTSEDFTELKTYIWSQAALRDNWSQMSTDNPLDQLPRTLLFRIIQAAFKKGFDLKCVLPAVTDLLSSTSLLEAGVAQTLQFRFLIHAGFEQLARLQSSAESD